MSVHWAFRADNQLVGAIVSFKEHRYEHYSIKAMNEMGFGSSPFFMQCSVGLG